MVDVQTLTARFTELYGKGMFLEAADLCESLAEAHRDSGDQLMEAETKNNQSVAYLKAGRPQKALEAATGTDAIFAEAGDLRRQAMAFGNQAAALEALGKLEPAAVLYRKSAELLEKAGDRELYSIVMKALSTIYIKQGKQMDTIIALQASMQDDKLLNGRQKFLKRIFKSLLSLKP